MVWTTPAFRQSVSTGLVAEEHLAEGWEYDIEVVIDAPLDTAAQSLPRAVGRLELLDTGATRLVGSTSDPW